MVQQQINTAYANYRKDKQYEYYMYLQTQYANTSNNTEIILSDLLILIYTAWWEYGFIKTKGHLIPVFHPLQ